MALGPPRLKAMWTELRVRDCAKITYKTWLKKGHGSKAALNKRSLFKGSDIMRNNLGLNEIQTWLYKRICFCLVHLPPTRRALQRAKTVMFPQALCRITSLLNWVTPINALIAALIPRVHTGSASSLFFSLLFLFQALVQCQLTSF